MSSRQISPLQEQNPYLENLYILFERCKKVSWNLAKKILLVLANRIENKQTFKFLRSLPFISFFFSRSIIH